MAPASPRFPREALTFLRALKRNNDREWFKARKEQYEAHVRGPMVTIIERLANDFTTFAPDLVASPRTSLYRIYRDTRFSADKSPLKTFVAAVFPRRGLSKGEGAGLYFALTPQHIEIAGGMYAPQPAELNLMRQHLASNHKEFRAIVESPTFRRAVGPVRSESQPLQRVPRGFPPDHPAAEYLKLRQFLAWTELPATVATTPSFYPTLLRMFRTIAPLVQFLNAPLTTRVRLF